MKIKCAYCGGATNDDARGNCAACGAPRTKPTERIFIETRVNVPEKNTAWMELASFVYQALSEQNSTTPEKPRDMVTEWRQETRA